VREEIEALEHHAHFLAHQMDGVALDEDVLAIDEDAASGGLLQQVQAAQKGTLACARRTNDGDDLAAMYVGVDIFQNIQILKTFLQMGDANDGSAGGLGVGS